jgi:catechol 2,3-dioxygenase
VSEAIYLQDPDGLGIEVYADRPRSSWRARDGEIVMVTEPLDVASLLKAAGEARWNGMPSGTVIGHVHLHVGDLVSAQDFYHQGLGLDRTVWSYPGALFLSAGGYHHHLGLNTWAPSALPAGDGDARLLEWELLLPGSEDVRTSRESLTANGAEIVTDGEDVIARDPWGTAVRLRSGTTE